MNGFPLDPSLGGPALGHPEQQQQRGRGSMPGVSNVPGSASDMLDYLQSSVAPLNAGAYYGMGLQMPMPDQSQGMTTSIQEPGGNILQLPMSFGEPKTVATATAARPITLGYDGGYAGTDTSMYGSGGEGGNRSADSYTTSFGPRSTGMPAQPAPYAPRPGTSGSSTTGYTYHPTSPTFPAPRQRPIAPRPPPTAGDTDDDSGGDDDGEPSDPTQPWGMPQDEYKALSSVRKKQIRNKIGAKKFRAKRKAQALALETEKQSLADENASLAAQLKTAKHEINMLKQALTSAGRPIPVLHPVANGSGASYAGGSNYTTAPTQQQQQQQQRPPRPRPRPPQTLPPPPSGTLAMPMYP